MTHLQITRPAPSNRGVVETHRVPAHTAQQDTVPRSQTMLALDFDPQPGMPAVPHLRIARDNTTGVDQWAARFAQAVVEVVAGDRSVTQLLRCTTPQVYADLSRRTSVLHRAVPSTQRLRRMRSVVRSVHVFCPTPTVAEVSVHVRQGERGRAIAARIELRDRRWVCVAIEFG